MPLPGPDTRVVELRVPGLIGTSGEALLDSVGVVDVAGDGVGRVIRPSDRLRRPAPGPVLQALGRAIPRTLEGYLWSGMTSGGAAKAAWALLFPFSLANVAFWMLPPAGPAGTARGRAAAVFGGACRVLLRMAALLLTMLLVSQLAVVSLDLLATQCLAAGSPCLSAAPPWLREFPPARTVVGVLPLLLLVYVLHRVSIKEWAVTTEEGPPRTGPALPGDELRSNRGTPVLRCLHLVGALAVIALLLLGGPLHVPGTVPAAGVWWAALSLALIALVAAAAPMYRVIGRVVRGTLLTLALAAVAAAAVLATPLPPRLDGTDATVEGIGAALVVVCALFFVLLAPAALLARPSWSGLPRRLRPWAGGWLAAPVLALAGLLGGGFGAGLAVAGERLVGQDLRLPESYKLITMLWGGGLAVAAVLGLLGFAVAVPLRRIRRGVPEVVRMLQSDECDQEKAASAWARSSWERKHLHRIVLAIAVAMSGGAAALVVVRYGFGVMPSWLMPLSGVGVLTLGALAAGLLRVVYTAATGPEHSRHLGALADLVSFWPRASHPVVPPCYALKVMPELAARAREHLAEPNTRVVLAGYHLGGLLAVIAAGRLTADLSEDERERLGVLTAGSPLQWGYQRAFPAVLPHETLAGLFGRLDGRWRGLCRGTDTFGGGATTWRHQVAAGRLLGVGYLADGKVGPVAPAVQGPTGALVLGGDHWLPDPMRAPIVGRRWVAGVRRHSDYVADPEWDRAVAMAAGLETPGKPPRPLAEQVPLFGDLPGQGRPRRRAASGVAADTQQDENGCATEHQ